MSNAIDDGGPAFPIMVAMGAPKYDDECGMTLRDYFAAKALPGLLDIYSEHEAARCAYVAADAMLEARKVAKP